MQADIYQHLGVTETINCVGYATRIGGSCPSDEVLRAMHGANLAYVEMDDLQAAAWRVISRGTGAEAGIVTCGAAAGLTLGAAACLAGMDVEIMDRLPDTATLTRREILYPKVTRYDYEHPVRLSGARLVEVDYDAPDALARIEAAITLKTAAIGCVWSRVEEKPEIGALAQLARRRGLPLLVDAAMAIPPTENLHGFIRRGADLVALSGGKHLGGPQNSGLLFGRADLIRSAWVQMTDMHVRDHTWPLSEWVEKGWIARLPRHGIGRAMKVGKDAIVGALAALERYDQRDHAGEVRQWRAYADELAAGLAKIAGLRARSVFPSPLGQPYRCVEVGFDPVAFPGGVDTFHRALKAHRPKVMIAEDEHDAHRAFLYTMCLGPGHPAQVIAAFANVASKMRKT
jgi:D-glucosaminate-6-phosphate ammonia-lyase